MATRKSRPSDDVEVTVQMGHPNYWAVVGAFHGHETVDWWIALGDLLGGRPGWHCELTEHGITWSFGPMGTGLFNVATPDEPDDYATGRYKIFDYDADTSYSFEGTTELREWLEANEHRHADHLQKIHGLVSETDWQALKGMGIDVRVTHDGQTWIATVPKLLLESAFADDLPTLLTRVRELIAQACSAPTRIAQDISITARLDTAATAALK